MGNQRASVDLSYVRELNQRLILDSIFKSGLTSRTELSKMLSLSKPAVSDNLSELLRLGIVEEVGKGTVTEKGGRKPLLLKFNKSHKYIVAIDLNYSNPVFVLGNLNNEVIQQFHIRLSVNASPDSYIAFIQNGINILLSASGCSLEDLLCITIASPGVFDAQGNLLLQNPSYGGVLWGSINLRDSLRDTYNVKVVIKNDIKAATLGEWAYGAGVGAKNLLYISCGVGLGAGIVLNASLYEGDRFNAGQIYNYLDTGKLAQQETLEDAICIKRLLEDASAAVRAGRKTSLSACSGQIGFEDIVRAYKEGDPYVCEAVRHICDELCTLIFNFVNFLAIDNVIFGGEYVVFGDMLLEEYERRFKPLSNYTPSVKLATLSSQSGIHGLLYSAREAYFDAICNPSTSREGAC